MWSHKERTEKHDVFWTPPSEEGSGDFFRGRDVFSLF